MSTSQQSTRPSALTDPQCPDTAKEALKKRLPTAVSRAGPSPHYTAPAAYASTANVAVSLMRSSNEKVSGALKLPSHAPSEKA